jgi:hypothetical protein
MAWKLEWNLVEWMAAGKAGQMVLHLVEHWVASMAESLESWKAYWKVEMMVVYWAQMMVDYLDKHLVVL